MRYAIDISYKGTNYAGWQIQKNAHTVQAELEHKASKTDVAVILDRQERFIKDIDEIKTDLKSVLDEVRKD